MYFYILLSTLLLDKYAWALVSLLDLILQAYHFVGSKNNRTMSMVKGNALGVGGGGSSFEPFLLLRFHADSLAIFDEVECNLREGTLQTSTGGGFGGDKSWTIHDHWSAAVITLSVWKGVREFLTGCLWQCECLTGCLWISDWVSVNIWLGVSDWPGVSKYVTGCQRISDWGFDWVLVNIWLGVSKYLTGSQCVSDCLSGNIWLGVCEHLTGCWWVSDWVLVNIWLCAGYNVSIVFDLEKIPDNWEEMVQKAALLKRNCFASVFEKYFGFQEEGLEGKKRAVVHYRDDETMWVYCCNSMCRYQRCPCCCQAIPFYPFLSISGSCSHCCVVVFCCILVWHFFHMFPYLYCSCFKLCVIQRLIYFF